MLHRLLIHSPHLAQYIRNLKYCIRTTDFSNPPGPVAQVFLQLTRLRSLDVVGPGSPNKICVSSPIRRILLSLLHLPTLTRFHMTSIYGFDFADLIQCINLKQLGISILGTEEDHGPVANVKLDFPLICPAKQVQLERLTIGLGGFPPARRLCTARRPDGKPVVDLSTLKSLSMVYKQFKEYEEALNVSVCREMLGHCTHLNAINIFVVSPSEWAVVGFAATIKLSMHTLGEIELGFPFDSENPLNQFLRLAHEFEEMANHAENKVQSIRLRIHIFAEHLGQLGDLWGILDAALTREEWSQLCHVHLLICVFRCRVVAQPSDRAIEDVVEKMREEMRERGFKRLSASEMVRFTIEVEVDPR